MERLERSGEAFRAIVSKRRWSWGDWAGYFPYISWATRTRLLEQEIDEGHVTELRKLKRTAIIQFFAVAFVLGILLFGSAGTIRLWQVWVFIGVAFLPMGLHMWYLICNDPSLLERRLKEHEERKIQTTLRKFAKVAWLMLFLVSGFDNRFGWSSAPWPVVVVADVFVLGGQLLLYFVIKANSYASGVIELQEGQTVITTGPYALVRHPMYQAVMVMILFTPLALGSYWAMFPALSLALFYVIRIRDEEEMLLDELTGYREYMQETPYRLIPGIW